MFSSGELIVCQQRVVVLEGIGQPWLWHDEACFRQQAARVDDDCRIRTCARREFSENTNAFLRLPTFDEALAEEEVAGGLAGFWDAVGTRFGQVAGSDGVLDAATFGGRLLLGVFDF